jgi:hypothetical protein
MAIMVMPTINELQTIILVFSYCLLIGILFNSPKFLGRFWLSEEEIKNSNFSLFFVRFNIYHGILLDALFWAGTLWFINKEYDVLQSETPLNISLGLCALSFLSMLFQKRKTEKLTIIKALFYLCYSWMLIFGAISIVTR